LRDGTGDEAHRDFVEVIDGVKYHCLLKMRVEKV
jgi:hypothetical protein